MYLAGVDFSTQALDAALIPLDPDSDLAPLVLRRRLLQQGDPAERIRSVTRTTREILADVDGYQVSSVWVEEPFGHYRNADRALRPILGAIIASVPPHAAAAMIGVQEWRRELGLSGRLTKPDAITEAKQRLRADHDLGCPFTEHEAEAYLIALAGRQQCWQATAA